MATYGQLQEYKPESENITAYLERAEVFFRANDIAEDKQVPVFLSVVGGKTYSLLRDLTAPEKPQDKTLAQLFETLKSHFQPKPLVIAERFYFHRRNQSATESIAEYVAELRRLATHCEFGEYLNDALRDRLVCGLCNNSIQKRLLSEANLTFAKAVEMAQGLEAAERNARKLQGHEETPVNRVSQKGEIAATSKPLEKACYRCGGTGHTPNNCKFRNATCRRCQKKGHIARVCRSGRALEESRGQAAPCTRNRGQVHTIEQTPVVNEEEATFALFRLEGKTHHPIVVTLEVNGVQLPMEVDTGAAVSVISSTTRDKFFPKCSLRSTTTVLTTYTGEQMQLAGEMTVEVSYGDQGGHLPLYVVEGDGPSLMGRDWLRQVRLDWKSIGVASMGGSPSKVEALLDKYSEVFKEGLGKMRTFEASLHLQPGSRPKFFKARPVPFALKQAVEQELDRLEELGIIEKVTHSQWAAPVVPVPKGDGKIRLCGDYKVTINPVLEIDKYPLPKPDDLFATLSGGQRFTKIDLTHAYQQMSLKESSRELVTVNTHRGLYRYTRLPFGVASAPALFQQTMDTVLQGLPKVICYIDDILITGSTEEEHIENLELVLQRLQQYGIQAKRAKCAFLEESVEYLGHRIDATGLHTTTHKVEAISQAPQPENVQELRSYLGLLHYYGKFLPNLATLLHPLNNLLKTGCKWSWTPKCMQAFEASKKLLVTAPVLAHYDPALPMKMAGDASAYGIGAVISHVFPDGSERPIAFASRTLSASERNYAQVEREALSLVYGTQKFHQYLYGRRFTLVTDHKPLTTILGPKKGIPPLAAARLQRWALQLSAYSYEIEFKPTRQHSNADGLSRLPLSNQQPPPASCTFSIGQIMALPVTAECVLVATRRDPVLSKVHQFTRDGWPAVISDGYKPYWNRRQELSTEGGCLMWGNRVVIPQKLRARLVEELHRDHPGMVKMKAVARSYLWWPGVDKDLEECAKSCLACQAVRNAPAVAPLHPWVWPAKPWQRIHIDFAGPFLGKTFLIVIDAHSKWPEVVGMTTTTAQRTITELRKIFAAYGLPEQLVSDNGPQFVSDDFALFMKMNGIKHIRCAPYHLSSNGAAERFVQTFKRAMKAGVESSLSLEQRLANFLLTYRSTPHATTNQTPSQLFMGRELRTRLDLLRPDYNKRVCDRQAMQKAGHDRHSFQRELHVGQNVMAKNLRPGAAWVPGVVVERVGPLTYLVQVDDGGLWKRHIDHLRERSGTLQEAAERSTHPQSVDLEGVSLPRMETRAETMGIGRDMSTDAQPQQDPAQPDQPSPADTCNAEQPLLSERSKPTELSPNTSRYPKRDRKAPERYM